VDGCSELVRNVTLRAKMSCWVEGFSPALDTISGQDFRRCSACLAGFRGVGVARVFGLLARRGDGGSGSRGTCWWWAGLRTSRSRPGVLTASLPAAFLGLSSRAGPRPARAVRGDLRRILSALRRPPGRALGRPFRVAGPVVT